VSLYLSNMVGPRVPMHIDGVAVNDVRCHPIGDGNLGLGVAVYSYVDHINLGITADGELIRNPNTVIHHIDQAMRELAAVTPSAA
jgi:hypothetical protein